MRSLAGGDFFDGLHNGLLREQGVVEAFRMRGGVLGVGVEEPTPAGENARSLLKILECAK